MRSSRGSASARARQPGRHRRRAGVDRVDARGAAVGVLLRGRTRATDQLLVDRRRRHDRLVADHAGRDGAWSCCCAGRPLLCGRAPARRAALPRCSRRPPARSRSRRPATSSRCSSRWRRCRCPAFALVAMRRADRRGAEAALKFFLASVVATAFSLLGISLVYGATGSVLAGPVVGGRRSGGSGDAGDRCRHGADRRCAGLQGRGSAVPGLGARHLRRRAGAGRGLPLRREQGRRTGGSDDRARPLHGGVRRHLDDGRRRVGRADDDRRQPRRAATAACRPAAGLVVGGPGGLPAGAAGCRRHARRRDRCARLRPDVRRGEPRRVRAPRSPWRAGG